MIRGTLKTSNCVLQEVNIEDALNIVMLRNSREDSVLNKIDFDIKEQEKYLREYERKRNNGDEIYFKVLVNNDGGKANLSGLVRITELNERNRFCWESLIFKKEYSTYLPLDVMLTIYSIGFLTLEKNICGPWRVPKAGVKVKGLHDSVGMAELVDIEEANFVMIVSRIKFLEKIGFYRSMGLAKSDDESYWGF